MGTALRIGMFAGLMAVLGCSDNQDGGGSCGNCSDGSAHGGADSGVPNGNGGGDGGSSCTDCPPDLSVPTIDPPPTGPLPRVVAYVNCLCGFGVGASATCLSDPNPAVNHVKTWEDAGTSPITHYVISFLSFQGADIQTDPGDIWASGGKSTTDFALQANLRDAMKSAQAHGKKVMLSLGGEAGSSGFVAWWSGMGGATDQRVQGMRAKLEKVATAFTQQNGINVDGFDVDIELSGAYQYGSDKYNSTRDLINAVPEKYLVAFVPQVGNGLCAAPVVGDPLNPLDTLGGQCSQPVNGDDTPWALARLDKDCKKTDGSPKLDYWGIQYYNAGTAQCCGGGGDAASMSTSTAQNYTNLANGWPASGDTTAANNPWHQWAFYPGPWASFAGIGADRLVLGKPGCQGCAGSNYVSLADFKTLVGKLDKKLVKPMGGVLFWDLCRLFGNTGTQCVSSQCQPSWGGPSVLQNLTDLRATMAALKTK